MFQILRTAKLTTMGNISASGKHIFRERNTPNADPARTYLNHGDGARCTADLLVAIKARLKTVEVKDGSVLCIEHLVTASPEWFAQKTEAEREAYFADSLQFFEKKYGKKNIVCSDIQLDEKTPHMSFYVVPIVETAGVGMRKRSVKATAEEREATGKSTKIIDVPNKPTVRLSAKHYLGGREKLSDLQTEFHEKVSSAHGLERGVKNSKAFHQTLQKWYSQLEPDMQAAMSVIDDAARIKKAQDEREEALILQSAQVIQRAKVEADQLMMNARLWLKDAESHIEKKEEKLKEQAGENETLRLFLNGIAAELKAVFRELPEAVFFKLPDKLQDQLMRFFKITPIQKPTVEPAKPVEAPAPSPEPAKAATGLMGLLNTLSKPSPKPKSEKPTE